MTQVKDPHRKIVIFGNSGSGKSTLAKRLSKKEGLSHLDLDILAWNGTTPPTRADFHQSEEQINAFIQRNSGWVIEGCYSDLLSVAIRFTKELVFLNPEIETCIENAKKRPWEPHKYASFEKQRDNLPMLIDWIGKYYQGKDLFSFKEHQRLFDDFKGKKSVFHNNDQQNNFS